MAEVALWFPVSIYHQPDLFTEEQNKIWEDAILRLKETTPNGGDGWIGDTYNTHCTYDLRTDPLFEPLIAAVTEHVYEFSNMHGSKASYENGAAWANVSTGKNFQEFHTHNGSVFSAVYYISAPEGSGEIVFEDPKEPDMCPIKNIPSRNQLSFSRIGYPPKPGSLIIFRSYLRHMVEPGTNTENRISIAMNFN
jgi:uncharacterized protein (TIGR02466 family)